jgi:hypothetical protein
MLDWNFPQRIRVLERDPDSRRTTVINRPYVSSGTAGKLWEPLRASIGTTMGGIATIGQRTVFVEGISDQIILANTSAHLKGMRRTHFDLEEVSIVPYGEEISLKQLTRAVRAQNTRMVVLVDTDEQGVKAERLSRREGAPFVHAATFAGRPIGAIEDIVGPDDYIRFVNEFYQQFPWFTPLDVATVNASIGNRTLGRFLEDYFEQQFQQSFSKVAVSILMTYQMDTLSAGSLTRLEALIAALVAA